MTRAGRTGVMGGVMAAAAVVAVVGAGDAAEDAAAGTNRTQDAAVEQDAVVVTARPITFAERVNDYGGVVSSVGRDQLVNLNAQDLPSALRRVPGVGISRYNLLGAYGGAEGGSVYVRGQGAGRPGSEIKIYVDGVPREVGVWSHPLMDVVPVDYADTIDVAKGPQPYRYAGTFGSIEVTTLRKTTPGYETGIDLGAGEHGTLWGSVRHGGRDEGVDYYLGAVHKQSDGHRDHADGELQSQFVRAGVAATRSLDVSYSLLRTDNWSRDPGREDEPTPQRDKFATETLTHALRFEHEVENLSGIAVLYYEDGRIRWSKDHINGAGTPAGHSDTDWENYGLRLSGDAVQGAWTTTVGLEVEDEGGSFRNRTVFGTVPFQYDDRFTTLGPSLAARYEARWGNAVVIPSAGVRYYDHSEFSAEWAPHAGLTCRRGRWTVFAAVARGVNYPGVYAVGVAADTFERLQSEVLDHVESGVSAELCSWLTVQGSVFHDQADNLLQTTAQGLINVRDYETSGAELSCTVEPADTLSLFGALTVLDPEQEKTPRAPELSLAAGVNWAPFDRWRLSTDLEYVDEQYAFNGRSSAPALADAEQLGSYLVVNASLAWDVSAWSPGNAELALSAENVTDETYAFQPGYPMPGRSWFMSTRFRF